MPSTPDGKPATRSKLVYCVGSLFYAGASPLAPGTAGSAVTALLIWAVEHYAVADAIGWWWTLAAAAIVFIIGWYLAQCAVKQGEPDPQWFVLDEAVGVLLVSTGLAALFPSVEDYVRVTMAFLAFRFFDILKPPPIRNVERAVAGGLGVMLDDVLAACFAWPVAYLALRAYASSHG